MHRYASIKPRINNTSFPHNSRGMYQVAVCVFLQGNTRSYIVKSNSSRVVHVFRMYFNPSRLRKKKRRRLSTLIAGNWRRYVSYYRQDSKTVPLRIIRRANGDQRWRNRRYAYRCDAMARAGRTADESIPDRISEENIRGDFINTNITCTLKFCFYDIREKN